MSRAHALFCYLLGLAACGDALHANDTPATNTEPPKGLHQARTVDVDFSQGEHGFSAGFADYPAGEDASYELQAGLRPLPGSLGGQGFMLSGNNHSDDLMMFVQGPITHLAEGGSYHASMCVEFASDAPSSSFGVGGSPAESVYVKLGFVDAPVRVETLQDGYRRIAMDIGSQSTGGRHAEMVGNIAVDTDDGERDHWQIKRLCTSDASMQVSTHDSQAWAFVGFDSGFEATTTVYVTRLHLVLQ